ncbi:PREDICTED: ankyrin repeat and LEM domain-containing protein 1 [Nanorana parkeri]|uniref:ankyrin repeat and LEM domain-containing protein 1 n=1 Tax=Nanorana parkeri TaxID=125878 RepID=UPI0008548CC9|nr:PREDICTED: ankyrin repeat and LEM domain-containing protein 1 [Nanorana parkeri]
MAALARKLCEAVENEDAKEVENLLNCGADPNLILPDGIAAIHLASGKESESALRCLRMILQQDGDPNVRSIEELTPVHVAASWGCCKALIFLLRKGGDPSIQDQDGNTALDLALMEKNRRCVVALQEYERNEDIGLDQMRDQKSDLPSGFNLLACSRKLTESQFMLERCEGLDVTSPDHVYTYSRGHSDNDMEETLVLPRTDDMIEGEGLVGQEINSSSEYTSTLIVESAGCDINGELDAELCVLKKMMLATKVIHPVSSILSEGKSPCFFTERTRSRLLSSKSRHSNSSLFDESLEMPQRGRRLRSPDGKSRSPVPLAMDRRNFSQNNLVCQSDATLETCVAQNNICLVQRPKDAKENVSEPETTVRISNFLTDDLSSEAEVKSSVQLQKTSGDPYIESRVSESVWLTEDGDTESSGEAYHKYEALDSNKLGEALSAASRTGSFLHSTIIEDTAGNSTKVPRYSFSRLSCVPKADETQIKLTTIPDPVIEEVHLSPGGRPVNATHIEPVEYLYMDNEKGHALIERHTPCTNLSSSNISDTSDDTIIYDWRNYSSCKEKINKDSPACTPSRVAVELYRLSNDEIARRLRGLGEEPGPVNSKTRKVRILLLDKCLKEQSASGPGGLSFDYSPELSLALRTYDIPDCNNDEATLSREFDQPDKTRKWREGVLKSSFNYLLLDPRVTRNLPSRCHTLSLPECFRTFVQAVFYVGKGKRARPYCHLYESLTHHKGNNKPVLKPCSKVQHILDIWRTGQGVLSLHCFQNTIPVEAYTREACMVDAIGLKMLTNQKKGVYYGQAQNWALTRRRRLGVHMLHRAMQIFMAEGERQLRPPDIRSGS